MPAKPPAEQPLWWVTTHAPHGAAAALDLPRHHRQVTALARARSRAEFA